MSGFFDRFFTFLLAAAAAAAGAFLGGLFPASVGGPLGGLAGFLLGGFVGSRRMASDRIRKLRPLLEDLGQGEALKKVDTHWLVSGSSSRLMLRDKLLLAGVASLKQDKANLELAMQKFLGSDATRVATQLGGQSRGGSFAELTTVFVDLRGYTSLSEKISPENLLIILNEYLSMAEGMIERYKGHVNKFIGDAVMAYFDPEPDGASTIYNDAERAVAASRDIVAGFKTLQRKWAKALPEDVRPGVGCGVSSDRVFRGNIGTPKRVEYTLIGDGVNMASRLCSQAQDGMVIVSEKTYEKCKRLYEAIEWPPVQIKNKAEPQRVFQIMNLRQGITAIPQVK